MNVNSANSMQGMINQMRIMASQSQTQAPGLNGVNQTEKDICNLDGWQLGQLRKLIPKKYFKREFNLTDYKIGKAERFLQDYRKPKELDIFRKKLNKIDD